MLDAYLKPCFQDFLATFLFLTTFNMHCGSYQKQDDMNFLPTDDECNHHATLTACYQLAEIVLRDYASS